LASWPGPHTWILPITAQVPRWVTGAHDGLAVRISAHPLVAALCAAWGGPLVSTSANLAGEPPARSRQALDPALLASTSCLRAGASASRSTQSCSTSTLAA
ncbi:L-threonylcarbamoyladenylate synthase, partial [Xanthomonas arboricola]|uniref:L-threonylcarbamoyladenylate synthase n=1 Tax=Xanthomonas arboricola TaxID=56448 RepID=UPI002157BDA6